MPSTATKRTWVLEIQIVDEQTGRGLSGRRVEVWDKDFSKSKAVNDLLLALTSDRHGMCGGRFTSDDFQNRPVRHLDRGKPDIFFVVKDYLGNRLLATPVRSNLPSGKHSFVLKVDPQAKVSLLSPTRTKNRWSLTGEVTVQNRVGPFVVACYDKDTYLQYGPDDLLFKVTTDSKMKFRHSFGSNRFSFKPWEKERDPDLFFEVWNLQGQRLLTSPVFSNVKADANISVRLDLDQGSAAVNAPASPGTSPGGGPPGPVVNTPPTVQVDTVRASAAPPLIDVLYTVTDNQADPVHIEAFFSLDSGRTFRPATEAQDPASEGVTGLSSSLTGETHRFVWDPATDVPSLPANEVLFQIRSHDVRPGNTATSTPFDVGSTPAPQPATDVVQISSPQGGSSQGAAVLVRYALKDPSSRTLSLNVSYSTDNGRTFLPASEAFGYGSEGSASLASSPAGSEHVFAWNAEVDLPALPAQGVRVKVEASSSSALGSAMTDAFDVSENLPPLLQIYGPPPSSKNASPVKIEYVVTDRDGDTVRVEPSFSLDDGKTFLPATEAAIPGSDGIDNLAAPQGGENHEFFWDAAQDLPGGKAASVRFRMRVFDQHAGTTDTWQPFEVTESSKPSIRAIWPMAGTSGLPLAVRYSLSTPAANQQLNLEVSFSTDQGQTFNPATEAVGFDSEGLTNLDASSVGVEHYFVWDALSDIAGLASGPLEAILKLTAIQGNVSTEVLTPPVTLDPAHGGAAPDTGSSASPELHVFQPPDHQGIHVAVPFLLKHPDNLPVHVTVEYSADNEPYRSATAAAGSDHLASLPAPSVNVDYCFLWNAAADLKQDAKVKLRLTPYAGATKGRAFETQPFAMTIEQREPVPTVRPKPPLDVLTVTKIQGDNQIGIAGLTMPQPLGVEITDAQGEIVLGARVTFVVDGPNGQVGFLDAPLLGTTTDSRGRAGILVKPGTTTLGPLQVRANVAGVPSASAVFTLTSRRGKIIPFLSNPSTLEYGQPADFRFVLDTGDDFQNQDFYTDPVRPLPIKVTATNGELSATNQLYFSVVPNLLGGPTSTDAVQLKVTLEGLPSVDAYEARIPINTPAVDKRLVAIRSPGESEDQYRVYTNNPAVTRDNVDPDDNRVIGYLQDVRLHLEVVSGNEADPQGNLIVPQRGFPGVTLTTPFRVKVMDDVGNEYRLGTTGNR